MAEQLTRQNFSELTAMLVEDIEFKPGNEPDGILILVKNVGLSEGIYDWRIKQGDRFIAKIFGASPDKAWTEIQKYRLKGTEDIEVYVASHKNKVEVNSYRRTLLLSGVSPGDI